jgi:hypothetical protein
VLQPVSDDLPELADALPAAQYHCQQAVDRLVSGGPGHELAVVRSMARMLEAAGGPDVGNAVQAHLEQVDRSPDLDGNGGPRERVLTSARRLHRTTDDGLRAALSAVGLRRGDLVDGYPREAEPGGAEPLDRSAAGTRRAERVAFVGRVLADRRAAVEAVLDALLEVPPTRS